MDEQYFRKEPPRQNLAKWVKKVWKKKIFRLSVLVFIPVISFVLFSNRGVIQRVNLESRKDELLREVDQLRKDQQSLC